MKKNQQKNLRKKLDLITWLTPPFPKIMGILNVTNESFYDGGKYLTREKALSHALEMKQKGADILDIGGESTRPGSDPVSPEEELERVIPVIEAIRKETDILLSIDTTKAEVARQAVSSGVDIINDISAATKDPRMVDVLVQTGVPVVLMHMQGTPKNMQKDVHYENCLEEIRDFLIKQCGFLEKRGYDSRQIIIDPGIGFGKNLEHNLEIVKNIPFFKEAGYPVLVGPSRKSFLGLLTKRDIEDRLAGTLATLNIVAEGGAAIVRVHDVAETRDYFTVKTALS